MSLPTASSVQSKTETESARLKRLFAWRDYAEIDCRHWDFAVSTGVDVPNWGGGA
jgi:hypothetical protein